MRGRVRGVVVGCIKGGLGLDGGIHCLLVRRRKILSLRILTGCGQKGRAKAWDAIRRSLEGRYPRTKSAFSVLEHWHDVSQGPDQRLYIAGLEQVLILCRKQELGWTL